MRIMPIDDFEDGHALSATCHEADEPIFLTKNGYGNMVAMSIEVFERYERDLKRMKEHKASRQRTLERIARDYRNSLRDYRDGECVDARAAIAEFQKTHSKASGAQETAQ